MEKENLTISEKLIYTNLKCNTKEQVIEKLSGSLFECGLVKEEFFKNILLREKDFPTGIEMKYTGIAIPHTDSDYVIESAIAVAVLENPVKFLNMGNDLERVDVKIVFLLALNNSAIHLNVIKKIMNMVNDKDILNKILSSNEDELKVLLQEVFN